jgi:hypothetical protein
MLLILPPLAVTEIFEVKLVVGGKSSQLNSIWQLIAEILDPALVFTGNTALLSFYNS